MHPHHDVPGSQPPASAPLRPAGAMGDPAFSGDDDGFLGRFPEAVAAGALADGSPARRGGPALGYRIVLYASLAVGAVTGLSLIAAWILQAVLTGSFIRAGGDYFSASIEASAARELLSIPVGGFVAVVLLCLAGMCVGAWGIQRGKARTAA